MAQAVCRWSLTARSEIDPRSIHVGFVVDKLAMTQVFLRVLRVLTISIIPLTAQAHSFIHHRRFIILAIERVSLNETLQSIRK